MGSVGPGVSRAGVCAVPRVRSRRSAGLMGGRRGAIAASPASAAAPPTPGTMSFYAANMANLMSEVQEWWDMLGRGAQLPDEQKCFKMVEVFLWMARNAELVADILDNPHNPPGTTQLVRELRTDIDRRFQNVGNLPRLFQMFHIQTPYLVKTSIDENSPTAALTAVHHIARRFFEIVGGIPCDVRQEPTPEDTKRVHVYVIRVLNHFTVPIDPRWLDSMNQLFRPGELEQLMQATLVQNPFDNKDVVVSVAGEVFITNAEMQRDAAQFAIDMQREMQAEGI